MKTAISIPDPLFHSADALAQRMGISRSKLFADALASFVVAHDDRTVTRELDALYTKTPAQLDAAMASAQTGLLSDEGW